MAPTGTSRFRPARLTPLAADWVKARKVTLGFSDVSLKSEAGLASIVTVATPAPATPAAASGLAPLLWWCDGPCGGAKGAIVAQAKESSLSPITLPSEARQMVPVIKLAAAEIKAGRAAGVILLVQSAAAVMVFANRCPSLRAIVGTCLEAVEQGIGLVGANVLVIEHPYKTLPQVKSLVGRFARGVREPSDEVRRQLQELASCP